MRAAALAGAEFERITHASPDDVGADNHVPTHDAAADDHADEYADHSGAHDEP